MKVYLKTITEATAVQLKPLRARGTHTLLFRAPVCGRPLDKSPTISVSILRPLILGNSHICKRPCLWGEYQVLLLEAQTVVWLLMFECPLKLEESHCWNIPARAQ